MRFPFVLLAVIAIGWVSTAEAQRLPQYSRSFVESPQVLARGGTAVALAGAETAVFYNPAHLARLGLQRPRVEIFSVQGGVSSNLAGNLRFLLQDVRDAAGDGFSLPLSDEERELFEEALDRGSSPTLGQAAATLPSVMLTVDDIGIAGGLYTTSDFRLLFDEIGAGIPRVDFFGQLDIIAAASAGMAIPDSPLAAGATARLTRRYLTSKDKNLLLFDPDDEQLYLLNGTSVALDVGLHAADLLPGIPGSLDAGIALYDLIGGGFAYSLDSSIAFTGDGTTDQEEVDRILAAFEDRDGAISMRIGAAYHLPSIGDVSDVVFAIDWVSASTSESTQSALMGLRLGAEANVAGPLTLRTGISQGYPTVGLGLNAGPLQVDYSLFGVEEGRLPGQLQRYTHMLRLSVGLW